MSALAALAFIFLSPLAAAVIVGAILPAQLSLGGMLAVFFLTSIVCVFVASEAHAGKIRSFVNLRDVVAFGIKAFGWWAAGMTACGSLVLILYMGVGR